MKRNLTIDLLRVLAILGVIIIHVSNKSFSQGFYDITNMLPSFATERFVRFAVPLFYIISGYILTATYHGGLLNFYKKRATRLLVPYVVWSFFYMLLSEKLDISKIMNFGSVGKLLNGTASIELYFIPSLFILYISFPLLYKLRKRITYNVFLLYTLVEIGILSYDYYVHLILNYDPLRVSILSLYLFVLGMITFIHGQRITEYVKKHYLSIGLLTLFGGAVFSVLSALLFNTLHGYSYLFSQWQPFLFLYAALLWFLSFTWLSGKNLPVQITYFSKLVYFVFFVHLFYLSVFWKILGSYLYSETAGHVVYTVWFNPLASLIVIISSFLTAMLLKKISVFNSLVGIDQ